MINKSSPTPRGFISGNGNDIVQLSGHNPESLDLTTDRRMLNNPVINHNHLKFLIVWYIFKNPKSHKDLLNNRVDFFCTGELNESIWGIY